MGLSEQVRKEMVELEEDGAQTVAQGPIIQNFAGGNAFIAKVSAIEPLNAGETQITKDCLVLEE